MSQTAALFQDLRAEFERWTRIYKGQLTHLFARVVGPAPPPDQLAHSFRQLFSGGPGSPGSLPYRGDRITAAFMRGEGECGLFESTDPKADEHFEELAAWAWRQVPDCDKSRVFEERPDLAVADPRAGAEEWLLLVYRTLQELPGSLVTVKEVSDSDGTVWSIRALTVDPFEASAIAVRCLLEEWRAEELPPEEVEEKPVWDKDKQELRLGGRVLKQYENKAENQTLVLAAFQEQGWPERVDSPFAANEVQRLHGTLGELNKIPGIRFCGDGYGGIRWRTE